MRVFRLPDDRVEQAFDDLFDSDYYLMRYPEVQDAVIHGRYESALDHYIHEGSNLLHDPYDIVVSRSYLEQAKYLDGFSLRKLPRSKQSTLLWHSLTVRLPLGKSTTEFRSIRHSVGK